MKLQGLFLVALCNTLAKSESTINTTVVVSQIDELFEGSVNSSQQILLQYNRVQYRSGLRVFSSSAEALSNEPLVVVARQLKGVLSWPLPYGQHHSVNRTLCPIDNFPSEFLQESEDDDNDVYISVSTSSKKTVGFSIMLYTQQVFQVDLNETYSTMSSPSAPIYFQFNFPEDTQVALLSVTSPDNYCTTLSVQNISCPVYDLERNVEFKGLYQTIDRKAGMTFTKEQFPQGLYILFLVKDEDDTCNSHSKPLDADDLVVDFGRIKRIEFKIQSRVTKEDYLAATFGVLAIFAGSFVVVLLISCVVCIKDNHNHRGVNENSSLVNNAVPIHRNGIEVVESQIVTEEATEVVDVVVAAAEAENEEGGSNVMQRHNANNTAADAIETLSNDSSLDETDMDFLPDAELEKDIFRTKTFLYVSDLARKKPHVLAKKSTLYHWNLVTVTIFYGLPVVQLVLTYQNMSKSTGNQDLCYYNFLCAHPLGVVTDFNHVYSNLGYVMLGTLFIGITSRRDFLHQKAVKGDPQREIRLGIPQHFGMYYAMGLALVVEGIMSGCYHVCPNHTNFQFDTAYMYTIAVLILLKIYQTRHPDINANAYTAFGCLAFIIFIGVIGVLHGNMAFWIVFIALHVVACLVLSIQIYYMGRWTMNVGIFKRMFLLCYNDMRAVCGGHWRGLRPMYMDRMILLLVMNAANWALDIYGITQLADNGKDFASFLLAIMISNVLLYTLFYILMKLRHRERITGQPATYIIISCFTWAGAMYFFLNKSTTWVLSPAESRHYNQECRMFHFYDNHDIWHFLSAGSLFLSFMILLTLDDDLDDVPRDKIAVF